jgi:hypothetical protein
MPASVITPEDLAQFKKELIHELLELILRHPVPPQRWLRAPDARKLLGVSPNTLRSMREEGGLPFSRIKGVVYYAYGDIVTMMEKHQVSGKGK